MLKFDQGLPELRVGDLLRFFMPAVDEVVAGVGVVVGGLEEMNGVRDLMHGGGPVVLVVVVGLVKLRSNRFELFVIRCGIVAVVRRSAPLCRSMRAPVNMNPRPTNPATWREIMRRMNCASKMK